MGKQQEDKSFEADGIRPIESGNLEIVDTFSEEGIRPITRGPNQLISNTDSDLNDSDEGKSKTPPSTSNDSEANQHLNINNKERVKSEPVKEHSRGEIDSERPVDTMDKKFVDTFVDDGTRPIGANDYEVVARLNIDGERPITSQQ